MKAGLFGISGAERRFARLRVFVLCLAGLILVGFLTRPVEAPAWAELKSRQPELRMEGLEDALGQGMIIGVVGGLRTIVADFVYIRLNSVWERRDRVALDALLRLVTTLDPRPEFFWINGARMVAYDVPNWRIREAGGYAAVPERRQREIDREQAEQAFAILERAREFDPDNPRYALEIAQIYLNRLKDRERAAEWFLKAWEMGGPFFTARIHAELLKQTDRPREAYAFLVGLHRELPDDNPFAQKEVVLERIRELETVLEIPESLRYRAKDGR